MDTLFKSSNAFASLSIKDLIQARDIFHYHLMNKKNVVATALGLYRIRKSDPWPSKTRHTEPPHSQHSTRRTLFNSEVRPYSWPCVYVFVSEWDQEARLAKENASDIVPKSLYLPDGRIVPVCVIEAMKQPLAKDLRISAASITPRNLFGPGSPVVNEESQGTTRLATAGCIVRDAERYYVLTNRHALGVPGSKIKALKPHRQPRIGVTSPNGLMREDFGKIYPNFISHNQRLLMDIGLVDLDDVTQWKTDVPGIDPVGPVLDLYDYSFTLDLIRMKVVGHSAVTGVIRGEIHGLFYRFKSIGGSEYISDFLIGPQTLREDVNDKMELAGKNVSLAVRHGDSGTLLFIEHEEKRTPRSRPRTIYYPFAILWGKEEFFDDGKVASHPFALATALSPALDRLNLDLVRDINLDQQYVWGWVGHYVIGGTLPLALGLLGPGSLTNLAAKNIVLLTVAPDDALGNDPKVLDPGGANFDHPHFVALADVPDNVWKSNVNFYTYAGEDGKSHRKPGPGSRGQADNPNHFADMDLPYRQYDTFLAYHLANPGADLDPAVWLDYYASIKPRYDAWAKAIDPDKPLPPAYKHWGALPFRIWQLFNAMQDAAARGLQAEFLCAGGVLIHYLGDACQPLHTSYLSQGDPDKLVKRPRSDGLKMEADGVHGGYEDDMVDYGYQERDLARLLDAEIRRQENSPSEAIAAIASGAAAARAFIDLVAATRRTLLPREIVDRWVEVRASRDRNALMWETFGERTVACMARGSRYLAKVWLCAWTAGSGERTIGAGDTIDRAEIMRIYNDPEKIASVRLDGYSTILK